MVSVVTFADTGPVVSVALTGVVLQVEVSASSSTVSERGFLLGGISSVGGTCFRFWC